MHGSEGYKGIWATHRQMGLALMGILINMVQRACFQVVSGILRVTGVLATEYCVCQLNCYLCKYVVSHCFIFLVVSLIKVLTVYSQNHELSGV